MKKTFILLVLVLSACAKHKTPSIEGLDLTKIQSSDYFRENLSAAEKLLVWCKENVNPLDSSSEEHVIRNIKNCQHANNAIRIPVVDIRKGKTYKSY